MKITIIGGGLGGIMLAAMLQQRGIDYQLYEKSPGWNDSGYSLGVWPNTRRLMERLGLAEQFETLGQPIRTYDIRNCNDCTLKRFSFDPFYQRYGMAYTQINRTKLRQLIGSAVDPDRIHFNHRLTELPQADIIVGADGVYSRIREIAFGSDLHQFTGWRAWYVWIDRRFNPPAAMTEYLRAGRCVGLFDDGDKTLAIFFAACNPNSPHDPTGHIAELKILFPNELALLAGALDPITDDQVMSTDLARVQLKNWTRNNVVLLGDAAHAMEPHTGLGASMAMEDADVLADELAKVGNGYSIAQALQNYQRRRLSRLAIAQRLTQHIRRFAFISSRIGRWCADHLLPIIQEKQFLSDYFRLFDERT